MLENREQVGSMNITEYTGWVVLDADWSIKTMNHALGYDWLPKNGMMCSCDKYALIRYHFQLQHMLSA